jgi:type I restriction enzyme S subunit
MSEWVESPLRDLVSFKKGKKVETSGLPVDGFMPYLGASSLTGGEDGFASPYGGIECVADDALMLWDGERSGLVGPGKEGIISSTVMRLRPKGTVGVDTYCTHYAAGLSGYKLGVPAQVSRMYLKILVVF